MTTLYRQYFTALLALGSSAGAETCVNYTEVTEQDIPEGADVQDIFRPTMEDNFDKINAFYEAKNNYEASLQNRKFSDEEKEKLESRKTFLEKEISALKG